MAEGAKATVSNRVEAAKRVVQGKGNTKDYLTAVIPGLSTPAAQNILSSVGEQIGQVTNQLKEGVSGAGAAQLPDIASILAGFSPAISSQSPTAWMTNSRNPLGFTQFNATQIPSIDPALLNAQAFAQTSPVMAQQQDLVAALQARASGAAPSVAEQLLRSEQDRILQQQMALAASVSGRALPAAQRQVMQQQALGAQEAARQAAIMRAQEQQQSEAALANVLAGMRGQDIQRSGLSLEAQKANQAAQLEGIRNLIAGQQFDVQTQVAQEAASAADQRARQQLAQEEEVQRRQAAIELARAQLAAETAAASQDTQLKEGLISGLAGGAASYLGGA